MQFSMLMTMKRPTKVGIFIFISRANFILSWVEQDSKFSNHLGQVSDAYLSMGKENRLKEVFLFEDASYLHEPITKLIPKGTVPRQNCIYKFFSSLYAYWGV